MQSGEPRYNNSASLSVCARVCPSFVCDRDSFSKSLFLNFDVSRVALCREFERLGLAFPYLAERTETTATTTSDTSSGGRQEEKVKVEVEEEWQRKKLAAIDMEHSLCYFCRLLRSRKAFAERGTPVRF